MTRRKNINRINHRRGRIMIMAPGPGEREDRVTGVTIEICFINNVALFIKRLGWKWPLYEKPKLKTKLKTPVKQTFPTVARFCGLFPCYFLGTVYIKLNKITALWLDESSKINPKLYPWGVPVTFLSEVDPKASEDFQSLPETSHFRSWSEEICSYERCFESFQNYKARAILYCTTKTLQPL